MIEITTSRASADILAECEERGLKIKLDTIVRTKPGGRHWHLGFPKQPGVLELTDAPDGVTLKVASNRDGGWATALARELALRRTAQRVDAQMRVYRREHAIDTVWPTTERVLVCIGPGPWSTRLVRAAKRMADQIGAEWIAVHVETPAQLRLRAEVRDGIVQTLRLAEQLGGQTITLSGETMSDAILAYARDRNVSKIVVGKPTRTHWQRPSRR